MERCQDCNKKLTGRVDKRFCDSYCRSNYHNALNTQKNASFRTVNDILKQNASILAKLAKQGNKVFGMHTLADAGFNFQFFTHLWSLDKDMTYHCCYNYGYRHISQTELVLAEVPLPDLQCKKLD